MGRQISLGLLLAGVWLLLSGYFDNPLLLSFGAASVVLCVFLAHRAGVLDEEGAPTTMIFRMIGYWIWLAGEIGKANVAVARQALAVTPKLSPKMITAPMVQRTNVGRVIFANSITLTPGTITVEVNRRDSEFLVHALTKAGADGLAEGEMDRRVTAMEGRQ